MEKYSVRNIYKKCSKNGIEVEVPGSKSITNRALLLATLADGESILKGALFSDDSRHFLSCIKALDFEAAEDEDEKTVRVLGCCGKIPAKTADIYVGSAGTAARFLTAYLGVSDGKYYIDSSLQMKKRPMLPLFKSLNDLGAKITYNGEEGYFPIVIEGSGFAKDEISIDINNSSQFLSALLICAALSEHTMKIHVEGSHGMAYIDMTVNMMRQFGVEVKKENENIYVVEAGQEYRACIYDIEPDVSAACYFYAMAVILGITVKVKGVHLNCMQGDIEFLKIMQLMGAEVSESPEGIIVTGPENGEYNGVDYDMHSCSDQAITLAAVAAFAKTPTTITGISHIRLQESNRIAAIVCELNKLGIRCEELEDGVRIYPGTVKPAAIDTYDDHRMAMGFSLIGLRADGIIINDPECCRKTFEEYFSVLDDLIKRLAG